MKVGDLVSYTDIFGDEWPGVVTASYMDLVARGEAPPFQQPSADYPEYDHENLVEVYFNHGFDVLFIEQLNVYSAVAQW